MLRSRASVYFLALGGRVGVKVLYDCLPGPRSLFFLLSYYSIQQHTAAVVRVVSSIGLSSTAVVVIVNFQSFGPSRPDRR